jgi:hypothetical protein
MEDDINADVIRTEKTIHKVVDVLCRPETYDIVSHKPDQEKGMPSLEMLSKIVECPGMVKFPVYFSDSEMLLESMPYIIGRNVRLIHDVTPGTRVVQEKHPDPVMIINDPTPC